MIGFPFDSQVTYTPDGTPVYDRAVSSAPLRQLIRKMLSNGVLPNPSTNLQVQPGSGMNVVVNPGFAVIEGGLKYEETQRTLAVQASDSAYDRIDTVVMRWNDNTNARSCDLYVIQGVPAVSPVRPSLNREGSVYELGLADLFIAANSSAISAARITDTRYESERCGIISSISEFDSDTIYAQIQADLSEFKKDEQALFIEWFENIRAQLSEDAAGNLQLQINDLKTSDTKDNTVSFTSGDAEAAEAFAEVELLTSGEKHTSLWSKVSLMFKNLRRLMKLVGSTDISNIFDGTLTGAVSGLNSKTPVKIYKAVNHESKSTNYECVTSVVIPENSFFLINAAAVWNGSRPKGVVIGSNGTNVNGSSKSCDSETELSLNTLSTMHGGYTENEVTLYIWGKWESANVINKLWVEGFYIPA